MKIPYDHPLKRRYKHERSDYKTPSEEALERGKIRRKIEMINEIIDIGIKNTEVWEEQC